MYQQHARQWDIAGTHSIDLKRCMKRMEKRIKRIERKEVPNKKNRVSDIAKPI